MEAMMSRPLCASLLLILVACASGARIPVVRGGGIQALRMPQDPPKVDKCERCIAYSDKFMTEIVDAIAGAGVGVSCASACSMLGNNTAAFYACNVMCDAVGATAFEKLKDMSDLNAFYLCDLTPFCNATDTPGAVTLNKLTAYPSPSGPATAKMWIPLQGKISAATNPGEIVWEFILTSETGNKTIHEEYKINSGFPAGSLYNGWSISPADYKAAPGTYLVRATMCEGKCGSTLPHSSLLGTGELVVTVTAKPW